MAKRYSCKICGRSFKVITNTHLKATHKLTIKQYGEKFGPEGLGFALNIRKLPHSDPRWLTWKFSLAGRPPAWSKGFTKETHPGLKKISETFKQLKIDNFKNYRASRPKHPPLPRNGDCAEFIGVTLGDGHIQQFPRTERIIIVGNANNAGFVVRYSRMAQKLFHKKPNVHLVSYENAIRISVYQNDISARLGIPTGNRSKLGFKIPNWIWTNRKNLIRFLRGLYEAEGSFCVHKPTSTYKLLFSDRNPSLLNAVFLSLEKLGFHPHRSRYLIQLSRKEEVLRCKALIQFRNYDTLDSV